MPSFLVQVFFVFLALVLPVGGLCQPSLRVTEEFFGMPESGIQIFGLTADDQLSHVAYAVQDEKGMFVRMDKEEGPHFESIRKGTPLFGPQGHIMVYVGFRQAKSHVWVNGKEKGIYDGADSFTFSPTGQHLAYRVEVKGQGQAVVSGDKQGPFFRMVDPESLVMAQDGGLAYVGMDPDRGAVLMVNGREAGIFEGVRELRFSPEGHFACAVKKDGLWHLFLENTMEKEGYEGIQYIGFSPDSEKIALVILRKGKLSVRMGKDTHRSWDTVGPPLFSPDSQRLAYPAKQGERWAMVVDGKRGDRHDLLGPPLFSPDSQHIAWMAVEKDHSFYVVNHKKQPAYETVDGFAFHPQKGFAYRARQKEKWHLVTELGEGQAHDGVTPPLFHENGRLLFGIADDHQQRLVVDGVPGPPADQISPAVYSPGGQHVGCAVILDKKWYLDMDGQRTPIENITAFLNQAPVRFIDENTMQGLAYQLPGPRFLKISATLENFKETIE
ncbi:hypothetical protein [Desulfobotulus sp.]|jgi:hypothetical protein|uniref:TolB family protein n=1 Tax=Desulfobotulus sp. TaxID=1940337 RepID=UPI002A35BBFD|nr:hypothetical protein [Desulfobotulus sp.]MDY0161865.1 hypothetical protein [Desulfobotulus sp.]